ncbi:MAG: hypothetical protein P1V51_01450 [Deltaproteobacteria bacterium]|nr:hypothetical protein [Deltaproteobacteria bacterium]
MASTVLSRGQRRTAEAVTEALFASEEGAPPPARVTFVVDALEGFLLAAGPSTLRLYRWMLRVAGLVAPLLIFRLPGLARLPLERRIHALERLESGPLAAVMWGLKAMLCTAYWEEPSAAREIGFDARCLLAEGDEARPQEGASP